MAQLVKRFPKSNRVMLKQGIRMHDLCTLHFASFLVQAALLAWSSWGKKQGRSHPEESCHGHLEEKLYISEMSCINHMISNIYATMSYPPSFVYVSLPTNRTAPCRYIISVSRFMYTRYTSFLEVGKQLPTCVKPFPRQVETIMWWFGNLTWLTRSCAQHRCYLWTLTVLFLGEGV